MVTGAEGIIIDQGFSTRNKLAIRTLVNPLPVKNIDGTLNKGAQFVLQQFSTYMLRDGRDVHPTWVKSSIETLSNKSLGFWSTRARSEEDFDSY